MFTTHDDFISYTWGRARQGSAPGLNMRENISAPLPDTARFISIRACLRCTPLHVIERLLTRHAALCAV